MKRRRFLTASIPAFTLLAGCNSTPETAPSDGSTTRPTTTTQRNTGNPYFEEVTIDGPESAPVGSYFDLTVSATNTGSRAGAFTAALSVNPNQLVDQSFTVKIPDISPGESKTTTLSDLLTTAAGQYTFTLQAYGATHQTTVTPLTQPASEPATLDGLTTTITDLSISPARFTSRDDTRYLETPDSDRLYVFAHINIENTADSQRELPGASAFALRTGSRSYGSIVIPEDLVLDGTLFTGGEPLPAGSTRSGWVAFTPPRSMFEPGLDIAYQYSYSDQPEIVWQHPALSAGTTPPAFQIESLSPASFESSQERTLSIRVHNTGDIASTYRDVIRVYPPNSEEVILRRTPSLRVPPGGSATATTDVEFVKPRTVGFESKAMGEQFYREVDPRELSFGGTFESPTGLWMRVSDLRIAGDLTFGDGSTSRRRYEEYACAYVEVENRGSAQPLPTLSEFTVMTDGLRNEMLYPTTESLTVTDPFEGETYDFVEGEGEVQGGASHSGWMIAAIPGEYSFDDVQFKWTSVETGATAVWAENR